MHNRLHLQLVLLLVFVGQSSFVTESVDSVCRDTTYTQYMLIQKKSLQISETVHL